MSEIINDCQEIEDKIYSIRGKYVMLDSDLAKIYNYTNGTKDLNKLVKRHIDKFSSEIYFQISLEEYNEVLRFQFGTLEIGRGGHRKYFPYVFTLDG